MDNPDETDVVSRHSDERHTTAPNMAVVGCGYWGKNLVRNFHELGALAAIYDRDPSTAARMSERYEVPALDLSEIFSQEGPGAVAIAAPAAAHYHLASEAIAADKHVFVEKPLALNVAEAEMLCVQAETAGKVLMVGHLMQYHPAFLRLRELVEKGELGRLQYIYSNRLNLGKFRTEENILWSFAPHDISMILTLVGAEPDEVFAVGGNYLHKTVADTTTTHLSFPSGTRAHIYVSWLHPFKEQKLVVVGDQGMAVLDDRRDWDSKLQIYRHRIEWIAGRPQPLPVDPQSIELEEGEPLRSECEHFIECIATGQVPVTDGQEGVRVLRVLQAAQTSLQGEPATGASNAPAGVQVHESAYVDHPCEIGPGTKIWHFSHILAGTRIGKDCTIGQNVVIGPDVTVGDRCKIQNNVSIYKGVTLEDGVFCGPSCVFTNVTNPRAEIERKSEFKSTPVGRGATIGANATIVCGHSIGAYSLVAAGAVVTSDVPPHGLVAGVPARRIGWMSHEGERLNDDLVCPRSGRRYRFAGPELIEEISDART